MFYAKYVYRLIFSYILFALISSFIRMEWEFDIWNADSEVRGMWVGWCVAVYVYMTCRGEK